MLLAVGLALLIGLGVLVACDGPSPRPTTSATTTTASLPPADPIQPFRGKGPRVVVFGDSLAYGSTTATFAALTDFSLSWNVWGATTWRDYTGAARSVVPSKADIAVIAIGTNDLWDGWQTSDQTELDQFLRALGSPPCTVLVSYASGGPVLDIFHKPNDTYPGGETGGNKALAAAAKKRTASGAPTLVLDWGAAAKAVPGTFAWDNVHHTAEGDSTWAAMLKAELTRLSNGSCR